MLTWPIVAVVVVGRRYGVAQGVVGVVAGAALNEAADGRRKDDALRAGAYVIVVVLVLLLLLAMHLVPLNCGPDVLEC